MAEQDIVTRLEALANYDGHAEGIGFSLQDLARDALREIRLARSAGGTGAAKCFECETPIVGPLCPRCNPTLAGGAADGWRDALAEIAKELIARLDGSEGRFDINGAPMASASQYSHEIMLMRVALGLPTDDEYAKAQYVARFGTMFAASPSPSSTARAKCSVRTMTLSDGRREYWVVIECDGREITPSMSRIKGRSDYEAAEWDHVLNGSPKPSILAFDCNEPCPTSSTAQKGEEE